MQSNQQATAAQVQQLQAHLQSQNAAGQQHPQVITLQQLQNFLPAQQIQTITSADGHQVQVLSAPNETTPTKQIKQERFVLTPQMQPQPQVVHLQNLQSIPQQFIQVSKSRQAFHRCLVP